MNYPIAYQVGADAMAGAVEEVHALLPQKLPGKNINGEATGTLGENSTVNANGTLKDQGESTLLKVGWLAKVKSPRSISGSIEVLTARITEIDGIGINDRAAALFWLVVDHGAVGAGG